MPIAALDSHPLTVDLPLNLTIVDDSGAGVTGASPTVTIRRYQLTNGTLLDNYFWTGSEFVAAATQLAMTEVDATNSPGLYVYRFAQTDIEVEQTYNMYFENDTDPVGIAVETHTFVDEGTATSTKLYESEPVT